MTKRRRGEQPAINDETHAQLQRCEELLELLPAGSRILDHTDEKTLSLRRQLRDNAIADLPDFARSFDAAVAYIYEQGIGALERRAVSETCARVKHVLHAEQARSVVAQDLLDEAEQQDNAEVASRPFGEKQALMITSLAGPLFSSVARRLPGEAALDVSLPQGVHLTRIAPTPATETGLLMDLHTKQQAISKPSILESGTRPLPVVKPIKQKDAFASVRLVTDCVGAVLADQDLQPLRFSKRRAVHMAKQEANQTSSDAMTGIQHDKSASLQLDEALIEAYEPEADPALILAQLAALQNARFAQSPFKAPLAQEQSLAQQLQQYFANAILTKDLSASTLVEAKRRRSGYLIPRYAASYPGSLPPTADQVVLATRDQVLPHPEVSPLAKDLFVQLPVQEKPRLPSLPAAANTAPATSVAASAQSAVPT